MGAHNPSLDENSHNKAHDDILDQLMEADENKQLKVWSSEVERRDVYLTAKKTSPSWKKVIQIKYIDDKDCGNMKERFVPIWFTSMWRVTWTLSWTTPLTLLLEVPAETEWSMVMSACMLMA